MINPKTVKRNAQNQIISLAQRPDPNYMDEDGTFHIIDPFGGSYEIAECMKCGRHAVLEESRDGDGWHACAFGCGESDAAPSREWVK